MKLLNDISQFKGWEKVLSRSIDKVIITLAVCSIPATLASLSRITISGFQLSMLLHIAVCISIVSLAVWRHKTSSKTKLNVLLLLTLSIAVVGIFSWGLVGNGFLWAILTITFITLYYGTKAGVILAFIFIVYSSIIGLLYINGVLILNVNANTYSTSSSGWLTAIIGALLPLALTVLVVGTLYDTARQTLSKLEQQRVEITVLAERDSLTGLYNARVFHQLISQAIERSKRHDSWVYLVNIDLDKFKQINDAYGHHAGDCVLKYVANQLLKSTRSSDTLCRVGGDEFLMLVEQPKRQTQGELKVMVDRLKNAIEMPYEYEGHKFQIHGSIGLAEYNASTTIDLQHKDDILKRADREMFKDKERSRRAQQAS